MAAAEGAACGESRPTASGQGGPTAPCHSPDARKCPRLVARKELEMPAACGRGERTDNHPRKRRRIQRNPTLDAASAQDRANELARKTMPADQFWKISILTRLAEEHRN